MNNINKPLVHKIKHPDTFSGKTLLAFLQSVFKEITGNYLTSAHPLSIIEPYFNSDEQGESFWLNALAMSGFIRTHIPRGPYKKFISGITITSI